MLARGVQNPDLFNLQQQQYNIMAEDYQRSHMGNEFPLQDFAQRAYQMRLNNETNIITKNNHWRDELKCMERYKMAISRQFISDSGEMIQEWYFRHDKIQDFFMVQTFFGVGNDRLEKHISDPRFRGVYLLLATLLPLNIAMQLRETLIQYAAKTQDHSLSDTFVQLLAKQQKQTMLSS